MDNDPRHIWEVARRLDRDILDTATFASIAAFAETFNVYVPDDVLKEHFQAFELDFLDFDAVRRDKQDSKRVKVVDHMTTPVRCVEKDMSVKTLCGRLTRQMVSGFPVVDSDDRLVGVVSHSDVVRHLASPFDQPEATVAEIMTSYVITTTADASIMEALHLMLNFRLHRTVVVDEEKKPIGILTTFDIAKTLQGVLKEADLTRVGQKVLFAS